MNVSFEHHGAWLLLALPLAAVLVWWLYFHRPKHDDWKQWLRYGLAGARYVVLALLAFLLLEPLIVRMLEEEELPKLLIFQDRSASIDSTAVQQLNAWSADVSSTLSEKYDVVSIPFADQVALSDAAPIDPLYTDFGSIGQTINETYSGASIGAVVVASDGIQTKGMDPRQSAWGTAAPLYSIGLGDTTQYRDAEVSQVLSNRLVFLGNELEIKARVRVLAAAGTSLNLELVESGEVIDSKALEISQGDFSKEVSFLTTPKKSGQLSYTVRISRLENERNTLNNAQNAYVEVLDNRTQITLIAKAPHPDIAAIKQAVEKSDQYEVRVVLMQDWDNAIDAADMYILHGLPSGSVDHNFLKEIVRKGKQTLVFYASSTSLVHFNALEIGVSIERSAGKSDKVNGRLESGFNLFNVDALNSFSRFPPVDAPFGEYVFKGDHQVLFTQKIGGIETDKPLMVFTEQSGQKHGAVLAEGWWRWRLFEAALEGNTEWTDRLILKAVQYLAIREKRSRLRISIPGQVREREEVIVQAEYYNESFELNNDPEIDFSIEGEGGEVFSFRFKPKSKAYTLSLGSLPPGKYTWKSSVRASGQNFEQSGELTVIENKVEFVNLVADHRFLGRWAEEKGGRLYLPTQLAELEAALQNLEGAKPVIHTSNEWSSIIEWKWLVALLILLLTMEWFVRKYTGFV